MSRARVAIILGFSWGEVPDESYEKMAESYAEQIKGIVNRGDSSTEAQIFRGNDATNDALRWLRESSDIRGTIVFPTRGALPAANQTLKQLRELRDHRRIRVVVLTGLLPDDEVVTLDKSWVHKIGWGNIIK